MKSTLFVTILRMASVMMIVIVVIVGGNYNISSTSNNVVVVAADNNDNDVRIICTLYFIKKNKTRDKINTTNSVIKLQSKHVVGIYEKMLWQRRCEFESIQCVRHRHQVK